jgi:translation initiation factor 1
LAKNNKVRIDTSGSSETFGSDAFKGLSLGNELISAPRKVVAENSKAPKAPKRREWRKSIRLDVKREKSGRGGKTVTVIYGISAIPSHEQKELLKSLKKQFATGGTAARDTIEIQGDFAEQIVEILKATGYQAIRAGG